MIKEAYNLLMALVSGMTILLEPAVQIANGVDLYMEASLSSPLLVSCPPPPGKGSWICSERRPLPECYLFCPSGLIPASEYRVDCETYREDKTTHFSGVPAGGRP